MSLKTVEGNLLDCKESFLCHQCNCVTKRAAHLAKSVFERFSYADVYCHRTNPEFQKAGTIEIRGNGKEQRFVIAMFAQIYPGKSKFPLSSKDGFLAREKLFYSCLAQISKIPELKNIAFPFKIGCGAAGGNWKSYLSMIKNFEQSSKIDIVMYKLDL